MPKKRVPSLDSADDVGRDPTFLARWQATGPSLAIAVGSGALFGGLGTVVGAVVFAPVVYAFARLRAAAPDASNAAGLVACTLGRRWGTVTVVLQALGFLILAVLAARVVGAALSAPLLDDPTKLFDSWLWPIVSMVAVAVLGLLVVAVPDRVVAGITAVLAVAGVLIFFYLALAVVATILTTGRGALDLPEGVIDTSWPSSGLADVATLATLAVGLVGVDAVSTHSSEVRSVGRPMAVAVGAAALLALPVWYADHIGTLSGPHVNAPDFGPIAQQLFPRMGLVAIAVGGLSLSIALLLAFLWGVTRLLRDLRVPPPLAPVAIVAVIAAGSSGWLSATGQDVARVGVILLLVVYAVVVEASARLGDSTFTWWSRFLTPAALTAIVVLPLLDQGLSTPAVVPVVVAAVVVGVVALATVAVGRTRPG